MSKSLEDALGNRAWSVSAVVFDLNDILDDEGRPISERRANADVRRGVEMEMRLCPYPGVRNNKWMNHSALIQISNYYTSVLAEMAAFRRQRAGEQTSWDDIHAGIIDLLARPAIHLLQQRSLTGPVPAQLAVSHKLAAGFFGVMRKLHERLVLGASVPVTADAFMQLVDETNALVGGTEVCAGSLKMIRHACEALIEGQAETRVELDQVRLDVARSLALQVQLGIFWDLYDHLHLWSLLRGEFAPQLRPYNQFLTRKIEETAATLPPHAPARPNTDVLPAVLDADVRQALTIALNDAADPQVLKKDMETVAELLGQPGSVLQYVGEIAPLAQQAASYLHTQRLFKSELSRQEQALRKYLGYPAETPIRLGTAAFPMPQALPWYERIVGRHLGEDGYLSGNSLGLRVGARK